MYTNICHSTKLSFFFWFVARTKNSGLSDNISGDPRSSETPQYDVMIFTAPPEDHETNVYLTISDDALSKSIKYAQESLDSAIRWAELADKLASMTDEEFRRQFEVSKDFISYM